MAEKIYRPNVAAIVLSSRYPDVCEIFIANRNDMKYDVWQFPQGGVDEDESLQEALFRELKEEIGTNEVEVISEYPQWLEYDFPKGITKKSPRKLYPYDGQKQKYFLVKLKPEAVIDLNTSEPEFDDYKFIKLRDLHKYTNHMKRPIYKKVLDYFIKNGYIS